MPCFQRLAEQGGRQELPARRKSFSSLRVFKNWDRGKRGVGIFILGGIQNSAGQGTKVYRMCCEQRRCSKRANLAQVKVIIFHQRDSDTRKTCEDLESSCWLKEASPCPRGRLSLGSWAALGPRGGAEKAALLAQRT